MELFERIRYLCEIKEISQTKFAKKLGISQSAFNRWLKKETEHNLWNYLPQIIDVYPDIRKEWLYIGDGPIFKEEEQHRKEILETRVEALENEVQRLRTQIFVEGASDQDGLTDTGKAAGQE